MNGRSFRLSRLSEILVERGNLFFRASGPFLLDFEGIRIVRYFGSEKAVTIPSEIEILGTGSFSSCAISTVRFDSMSKVSVMESEAFGFCGKLRSITIPSSVTVIGESCFGNCHLLQVVSFEPDSQLTTLIYMAFEHCFALKSIDLPSSLEIMEESCFFNCSGLEVVTFPTDSKLVRIGAKAFDSCRALKSLSLPPLLEFVGRHCFLYSLSLSTLTFASPSRLRELLDVPPAWTGMKEIPDSVEILRLSRFGCYPDYCTLIFGDESRLRELRTNRKPDEPFHRSLERFRVFARATSRSLKLIRSNIEFDGSGWDEFESK
jgi:hypothetical protein